MDEQEFKSTYAEFNTQPCIFAKAILRRCVACSRAQRLYIAEREAVGCTSPAGHARCHALHDELAHKALFALRLTQVEGPLPHGKEMKVQCGGLLGLSQALDGASDEQAVEDIYALLDTAERQFGALEQLPYPEIVKRVVGYEARRKK